MNVRRTFVRVARLPALLTVALLTVALLTAPACKQDPMAEQPRTRLTEIAASPTQFEGEQTVVTGIVRFKYAPGVYVIGPEGNWPREDQRVLVVSAVKPDGAADVYEGNRVRLLGTVQVVDRDTFAEKFPVKGADTLRALGDDFFREWEHKPAITATEVHILKREKNKKPTTNPTTRPANVTA